VSGLRPPAAARARVLIAAGRFASGLLFSLGLLGVLKTGTDDGALQLFTFTVHPAAAAIWLVLGLVGIAMSVDAGRAQVYLIGTGALLVGWGLLALALGGGESSLLTRDTSSLVLHLVGGGACLFVALAPLPGSARGAAPD
jgi:Domain of unknown function (DUF4383)